MIFIILVMTLLFFFNWLSTKPKNFPPGPSCIPLLGTTPFLPLNCFHLYLEHIQKRFGTVIGLKIGWTNVVGVTGTTEAREVLLKSEFQGRSKLEFPRTWFHNTKKNELKLARTCCQWELAESVIICDLKNKLQKIEDTVIIQMNDMVNNIVFDVILNGLRMSLSNKDLPYSFYSNNFALNNFNLSQNTGKNENFLDLFRGMIWKDSKFIINYLVNCLIYFVTNPKKQEELFTQIKQRWKNGIQFHLNTVERYPAVKALLTEVKRCDLLAAMTVPHKAIKDAYLNGYKIPKGTVLFINAGSILQTQKKWRDPELFKPIRFLSKYGEFQIGDEWNMLMEFGQNLYINLLPVERFAFLFLIVLIYEFRFEKCGQIDTLTLDKFVRPPQRIDLKLIRRRSMED